MLSGKYSSYERVWLDRQQKQGGEHYENSKFHHLGSFASSSTAWAQARKPSTIAELATYRGADRERCFTPEQKPKEK